MKVTIEPVSSGALLAEVVRAYQSTGTPSAMLLRVVEGMRAAQGVHCNAEDNEWVAKAADTLAELQEKFRTEEDRLYL